MAAWTHSYQLLDLLGFDTVRDDCSLNPERVEIIHEFHITKETRKKVVSSCINNLVLVRIERIREKRRDK